ncbi:glycosyl transferase [Bacteroidia bacterium]|nr:glycosyl transferase [Bacteroidia bacterium]
MTVISLQEFESEELLAVKPTRNKAEYCWTCSSSTVLYAIQRFNLDHGVYLDADLLFFSSPQVIFEEIEKANASVAITKHFMLNKDLAGEFCVHFVYFKNDADGRKALQWWRDSCIDWCFARYENGKYGDQRYLESFAAKFKNVLVIKNRGAGVAPWNMRQYKYLNNYEFVHKDKTYPVVFFHYHGTRINVENNNLVLKAITYDIPKVAKDLFFMPFLVSYKSVCETYFGIKVNNLIIKNRKWHEKLYSFTKRIIKSLNVSRVHRAYYFLVKKRYEGYEQNTIYQGEYAQKGS